MDRSDAAPRAVLLGHLIITVPVVAIIPLVLLWGLYQFGPFLWPYYLSGGLAIAWQWYSMALPGWEGLLRRKGLQDKETREAARRCALVWPGAAAIGSLAFHTTAAAVCGIHLGPWLLSRWFVWILPLVGMSSAPSADYWLQHLELVSIVPAFAVGFVVSRNVEKLATWAWILPTMILSYKLLTFTDPHASVLASDPWSRFSYYFVIERYMPTLYNLRGSDPIRVAAQMTVVVPFYSGVAYSIGALLKKSKLIERIVRSFLAEPEPEVFLPEEAGVEWIGDAKEHMSHDHK